MSDMSDEQYEIYEAEETPVTPLDETTPDASGIGEPDEVPEASEDPAQELSHKRAMIRSVIISFAAASGAVAALPLPLKDAVMLSPIELAEVNALANVYDIPQDNSLRKLLDATMELGVVSMAARGAISIIDRSARKRVLSAAKSALIAATIVAGVGICSAYAFEQVYLGKVSLNELGIFNKIKNTGAWQKVSGSVSGGLEKVMSEEALEGFKVSLSELLKTVAPVA